jgi:hypothetical protein
MSRSTSQLPLTIAILGALVLVLVSFAATKPKAAVEATTLECPSGTVSCGDGSCCASDHPVCCSDWCCASGYSCGSGENKCVKVAGKSCQSCYNDYERDVKPCGDADIKCINEAIRKYKQCLKTCEP